MRIQGDRTGGDAEEGTEIALNGGALQLKVHFITHFPQYLSKVPSLPTSCALKGK